MSEAIWIELIKVLPAFLWIGFGFIALAIAKRLFTAQAPRMTRVETPWVTVELAQQAIEQAGAARGPAVPIPTADTEWPPFFPLPPQQNPGGRIKVGADDWTGSLPSGPVKPSGAHDPQTDEAVEDDEDAFQTNPPAGPKQKPLATPPADESPDSSRDISAGKHDNTIQAPVTEPNAQVPNVPPTYPVIVAAPPGGANGYYPPPTAPRRTTYAAVPLPPYPQTTAYAQPAAQRGLRAATRLALSADLLQGGAILWVDDHPKWNESLVRLFRTAGITVDTVTSTEEAMAVLAKRSYDLVISDMARQAEPEGDLAGLKLLDGMIAAGIPTPAAFFTSSRLAPTNIHPRAVTSTDSAEKLVDTVVDIVGTRRNQQTNQNDSGWLGRLKGN